MYTRITDGVKVEGLSEPVQVWMFLTTNTNHGDEEASGDEIAAGTTVGAGVLCGKDVI